MSSRTKENGRVGQEWWSRDSPDPAIWESGFLANSSVQSIIFDHAHRSTTDYGDVARAGARIAHGFALQLSGSGHSMALQPHLAPPVKSFDCLQGCSCFMSGVGTRQAS